MNRLHALHGFLCRQSDWQELDMGSVQSYNLSDESIIPGFDGFWGWAKRFNAHVASKNEMLLGYSLGGRLAMHALLDNPTQWKAAIIVSAHTGRQTEKERLSRIAADRNWAERFENDPWDQVLADWDKQSVFAGIRCPLPRHENLFSRKEQGHLLRNCSRGQQDDLSELIQKVDIPLLWICGELDVDFSNAAKELKFHHRKSQIKTVAGAGHRVPWEKPALFAELVNLFINEVSL